MVNWRRPLTLIYQDNHKFGTGLYEPTLEECGRRYAGSVVQRSSYRLDGSALGDAAGSGGLRRSSSRSRPQSLHEDLHERRSASRTRAGAEACELDDYSSRSTERGRSLRRQGSREESNSARELRAEIADLYDRIAEREHAMRQDSSALRDLTGNRMMELVGLLREAEAQNEECRKTIRKQADKLAEYQNYCSGLEARLAETIDELAATSNKCKNLFSQIEALNI